MSLLAQATKQSSNLNSLINYLIYESDAERFSSLFVPPVICDSLGVPEKIDIAAKTLKNQCPPLSVLCRVSGEPKQKLISTSMAVGFISYLYQVIRTYGINPTQTYIKYDQATSTFYVLSLDRRTLFTVKVLF